MAVTNAHLWMWMLWLFFGLQFSFTCSRVGRLLGDVNYAPNQEAAL